MSDKLKIIEGLLRSKIEMVAKRNERFAAIQKEMDELKHRINLKMNQLLKKVAEGPSSSDDHQE